MTWIYWTVFWVVKQRSRSSSRSVFPSGLCSFFWSLLFAMNCDFRSRLICTNRPNRASLWSGCDISWFLWHFLDKSCQLRSCRLCLNGWGEKAHLVHCSFAGGNMLPFLRMSVLHLDGWDPSACCCLKLEKPQIKKGFTFEFTEGVKL